MTHTIAHLISHTIAHLPHLIHESLHIFSLLHECHIVTPGHHNHILEALKTGLTITLVFLKG